MMADRNDEGSSPRGAEGGGAPPFADFSSFRGMIREERGAARAEREAARAEREAARAEREAAAAAAEARVERETAAAEQRRSMTGVFELNLQPAEERGRRSGVARGGLWTARSRGDPRGPIENAVQSGAAAGRNRIVEQRLGLTAGCISGPCGGRGASLLQVLHVHKPQRAAETATEKLCRFKWKMVRTKSIRSKMLPCLMVHRPSFQLGSKTLSVWPSFTAYLVFSQMESMFQLPRKRFPSLLYRRYFPARMYKSISLPGTLSHGLSWIMRP